MGIRHADIGGSARYDVGATGVSTGTGVLFIGVNVDTAVPIKVDANGVVSVSGGGGGVQYTVGATTIGATGTGTIFLGINATTVRGLKVDADGVVSVSGGGGGVQYTINTTAQAATGTGNLIIGIQSGATTLRGWLLTTSGAGHVFVNGGVTITTGSVDITNTPTITVGNTPTVTVSTALAMPAVSGSVSVINTPTFTVSQPVAIYNTHIATQWNSGLVTITTSAAGVGGILKTSAGNTVYVTDIMVSVDVPMAIDFRSATTGMSKFYFATKGGMVHSFKTPMVCTTAQSFTFIPSLSGSASAWAAGYTVT